MKSLHFFLLVLLALLGGCASSGPSPATMQAEIAGYQLPRLPAEGKAIVYVVFEEDYYDMAWFDVFLDDQQSASRVGRNHGGQYFYFELTPGEHKIFSKGEKWAELAISARAGEVIYIRQELEFGMMAARVNLSLLDEVAGKYYVSKLKSGLAAVPLAGGRAAAPLSQDAGAAASGGGIVGVVTGGNWAKGIGFSNMNVKLIVTPEGGGEPITVFVRSDAKVYDVAGMQVEYLEAFKMYGKKVEIQPFLIQDATGGQPGRSDFAYEIGQQGGRTMHVLGQ